MIDGDASTAETHATGCAEICRDPAVIRTAQDWDDVKGMSINILGNSIFSWCKLWDGSKISVVFS